MKNTEYYEQLTTPFSFRFVSITMQVMFISQIILQNELTVIFLGPEISQAVIVANHEFHHFSYEW